ncbi:MAG TPA: transglutaminase family protein [Candidatus Binatia bacterium]|nr:transglutaminase family protein [Candidatus Binatia bacterium]
MDRRTFLKGAVALPAVWRMTQGATARAEAKPFTPTPGHWRTFEITTRVEVREARGVTRVWLPIPAVSAEYQSPAGDEWSGNAKLMTPLGDGAHGARMLYAEFPDGERAPAVELRSRVRTQDRALDWSQKHAVRMDAADRARWTKPTALLPTDGIVRTTAREITAGKRSDVEKVKAIYDWVLANAYRETTVRGCGVGDIQAMLATRNLGGKCADINALFVGLVRSSGVPARDVYGIRVAPSAFGYKALGAGSATITKAQHCRAEVFLEDHGWVAMDPADVTKVAREETAEWLTVDDPLVAAVRPRLFGGWEGNWIAFNSAHDVALPHATEGGPLGFLMYPQSETAQGQRDSLDPETFTYTITAREIPPPAA